MITKIITKGHEIYMVDVHLISGLGLAGSGWMVVGWTSVAEAHRGRATVLYQGSYISWP